MKKFCTFTFQKYSRSLLGRNTHDFWIAVWTQSPYWSHLSPTEWKRCILITVNWPMGNHLGETCRRTGRSWWIRPRAFANRCCSWISVREIHLAGSGNTRWVINWFSYKNLRNSDKSKWKSSIISTYLKRSQLIAVTNTCIAMPTNVNRSIATLRGLCAPATVSINL